MRTTRLLFILLITCLTVSASFATIIRVNNQIALNDNTNKIFIAFDDAYKAAIDGDTIVFEASASMYTYPSYQYDIKKRLVLIGTGFFLDKNPQTQADNLGAKLFFTFNFMPGSAGSVVTGLDIISSFSLDIYENNILVTRCHLSECRIYYRLVNGNSTAITGLRLIQNFFERGFDSNSSTGFSDVTFNNNIASGINIASSGTVQKIFASVENNTFVGTNNSFALNTPSFRNNVIIMGTFNPVINITSQNISNNLVNNDKLGTANGNRLYSVNDGALFSGNVSTDPNVDNEYQIIHPRFNTMGSDGKQPGAFGGANPYVLSGLPAIPAIYELSTTGNGSQQNGLPILIKVKSN